MNKLITIAAVGVTLCGLGRAAAENPCAHGYICTPCGPIGQYNAFSPVYKKSCCPYCGQPHSGKHCHLTQYNAFSPLVEDCSKKGWFHWLHHGEGKPADCCPPSGCDWGYQGDLPDCGAGCAHSDMSVFPQGVIQGQPVGEGPRPMPSSAAPAAKPSPASPEPLKAPGPK